MGTQQSTFNAYLIATFSRPFLSFIASMTDYVENEITTIQHRLSSLPRRDPERCPWLLRLALARVQRYNLSAQIEDLDKHILHALESILIPPWDGHQEGLALFYIACALLHRSDRFQKTEDVKYSIQYLCYLRDCKLPLEICKLPRFLVTELLVVALATRIEIEAGDETQIIEAMIGFCYELLASEIPGDYPVAAFVALGRAIHMEVMRSSEMKTLDRVIDCLREAVNKYPPEVHQVHQIHLDLAIALQFRLMKTRTASEDDYKEAISYLDKLIYSSNLGDNPSPYSDEASIIIARLTILQCSSVDRLEYTQEAISYCHSRIRYPFLRDESGSTFNLLLGWLMNNRSKQLGLEEFLQKVPTGDIVTLVTSNKHLRHPTTISTGPLLVSWKDPKVSDDERILSMTPAELSKEWVAVSAAAFTASSKASNTDIVSIEEAIKFLRLAINSAPSPSLIASSDHLFSFGQLLYTAFNLSGRVEYLEESISVDRRALEIARRGLLTAEVLRRLPSSLIDRWRLLGRKQDLDESMHLFHLATDDPYGTIPERLEKAYFWASHARDSGHPSVLTAYQRATSLMQSFATFAPTLEIQHAHLVSKENISKMPLEYASYLIHVGQLEQAVETLEHGRAILWSEMRGFRTSTDQLRFARPALADQLAKINKKLEILATSILQTANHRNRGLVDNREGDEFGRILKEQRLALEERDELVSHVREFPGFETFLKVPQFDSLRAAAARGPVIIINHCRWRSDILILLHHLPPSLIATADGFYDRANELKDNLVKTRNKYLPDSTEYEVALRSTLKDLYTLVGQPVMERLRELNIPEQSRVWWCPTSAFCALPLHAMGPILSDGTGELYFSDKYISSYTPTLSALIQSQVPGVLTPGRPSLLLVGRPEDDIPGVWDEIRAIETHLGDSIHKLVSEDATSVNVKGALPSHTFLHLACHGNLEIGKPFEAWFKLEGKDRLTLLDIVRSHLPSAEFAFLSACHSAELTDKSVADEALHLAAAMQYCGFRSVIGTLWAVSDEDGPELAKSFYKSLSSSEGKKTPPYRRTARALRNAVQKLRRNRRVTLERWVNFVHYGA
jgi:CHAT domain-containing protein